MRKLTPANIVRALRNRATKNLNNARAYWHYRNVDYRSAGYAALPAGFPGVDLVEYLGDQFHEKPLASYLANIQERLRQDQGFFARHLERSDELVYSRVSVYDHLVLLGDPPEWNVDITGQGVWPKIFFKSYSRLIRRSRGRRGDFRFTWELNRQQHLIGLALVHALSSDDKYADCVVHHIVSWIDKNPPFGSINWISSMEVGLRLISWCISLAQISSAKIAVGYQERISFSIYQQVRFLRENLSVDLSDAGSNTKLKNNHTIVELCALLVVLELFPMLSDGERLGKAELLAALESELKRQTYPDGMHVEQASSYLRFVLEAILVARLTVTESNGLDEYIDSYMNALAAFRYDEESIFVIGDEDNGHVLIPFYDSRPESLRVVLDLYEVFSENTAAAANEARRPLTWGSLSRSTTALEDSGHWICRYNAGESRIALYFRAGRLDFPEIPGYAPHAHCDLLGFVLSVDGSLWCVDRGTYSYSVRQISDELRYSSAHNTIVVDGSEQMRILGPFHNDRHAMGRICRADGRSVKGEMIMSTGDRSLTVSREIEIDQEGAEIHFHDVVSGLEGEDVTWVLNCHPDVVGSDDGWLKREGTEKRIRIESSESMEIIAVDYSPRYGVLEAATQLSCRLTPGHAAEIERQWSIKLKM
jgi:hypothetical protein